MSNISSDPYLTLAFWTAVGAVLFTLGIGLFIAGLRVQRTLRERREQRFQQRWRPLLLQAMVGEAPARLPSLGRRERWLFLKLWNHLQESVRGESALHLGEIARRLDGLKLERRDGPADMPWRGEMTRGNRVFLGGRNGLLPAPFAAELAEGGLFLDIGANAGIYSLWVASLRKSSIRVEAFEPDPELCAGMTFNLATNQINNVTVNQMALGRQEGKMRLVTGDGNKGENRVEADGAEGEGREVEMTTLKQFIAGRGIAEIDAVKIDIEGHEMDVLEPFFRDCPASVWPRLLICEVVHDKDSRLLDLLKKSGYKVAGKGRLNTIFKRESD